MAEPKATKDLDTEGAKSRLDIVSDHSVGIGPTSDPATPSPADKGDSAPPKKDDVPAEPDKKEDVKPDPVDRRIAKLTFKRREAERVAAEEKQKREALEKRVADLEKGDTTAPAAAVPNRDDFDDPDEYNRAMIRYETKQTVDAAMTDMKDTFSKASTADKEARTQATREDKLEVVLTEGRKAHADFDEVANGMQLDGLMQEAILQTENASELIYHLGQDLELTDALHEQSQKNPVAALVQLGRIAASLSSRSSPQSAKSKLSTKAPEPLDTVSGSEETVVGSVLTRGNMATYMENRKKGVTQ